MAVPGIRWHLLGAGAIGTLFAHGLAEQGTAVTLITRRAAAATAALQLESLQGMVEERQFACSHSGDVAFIDNLLVTTKAFDVAAAITGVAHRLGPHSRVVVLVNGMGFESELRERLPDIQILRGTTTEGAFRRDGQTTVHAGRGSSWFGGPGRTEAAPAWFTSSLGSLPRCAWSQDIDRLLWRKLAVNCVINPLTAVHHCRNGELLAGKTLRRELALLCQEVSAACALLGHAAAVADLQDEVEAIVRATAENRSSMLQDVIANRRTELDFLNGFLLAAVPAPEQLMPRNSELCRQLRGLQGP